VAWEPLISDPVERARLEQLIVELVAAIDATPVERTIGEHVDRAVLHRYVEPLVPDEVSGELLGDAILVMGEGGGHLGLLGGVAGLGWAVAHLTDGDDAVGLTAAIEGVLRRSLAARDRVPYDLVTGVVGVGVFAIELGDAGRPLARLVLDELMARAEPKGAGLAWFTAPALLTVDQRREAPNGHWDLGLAHGIGGVIALLARYVARGIDPRARSLLEGAVAFLLGAAPPSDTGRFPAWLADGTPLASGTRRLAWCYGDLGLATALVAAGRSCERPEWEVAALELAQRCAETPPAAAHIIDGGLCHGAAGAAHLLHQLYRVTGDEALGAAAQRWIWETVEMRSDRPVGGYPMAVPRLDRPPDLDPDVGLVAGTTGVALALHAALATEPWGWDRPLLVDLAPAGPAA
jgi:hypothetical protein